MIKRILFAICAVLSYCLSVAQVTPGTPPANYGGDRRRTVIQAEIFTDGLHTPSGGQPELRSRVWPGAGLLFTDSLANAFYYYSGGIFRNLADADCNGFIDIPQVAYQGTPFHFTVSKARYNIDCIRYTGDTTTIVIDGGDTLARKDVIYADATGYHVKKGEPSETPARPTLLAGQLFVTDVSIPAFDSLGTGINTIVLYDENTESTMSNSGIGTALGNSTAAPWLGTYNFIITTINNGDYWEFTKVSGTWDITNASMLSLFLQLRAVMPGVANLRVSLWNGTTQVSQFEPTLGFNKNNTTTTQGISISKGAFGTLSNQLITKIRFRFTSTNATNYTGFYGDYVHFVEGINQPAPSGGVSSVDLGVNGNALVITGPSTGAVTKSLFFNGNNTQFVGGDGVLKTYNALTSIGTFGSLPSDARGLGVSGATVAAQPVTDVNPGMTTPTMKAAWDSANARVVTNLGGYDSLAVYVDGLTTGFMSLKDSTGIGIAVRNGYLALYATGVPGGATGSEGLTESGGDIRLGGTTTIPGVLTSERSINLGGHILKIQSGYSDTTVGGAPFQFSYQPYSPLQFGRMDSIGTSDQPYSVVPLSVINGERIIKYGDGGKRNYGTYGFRFAQLHYIRDSAVIRSDGGDYNQVIIGEQRIRFDSTYGGTRGVARTGHSSITARTEGPAGIVSNTYIDNNDAGKHLYIRGTLSGFMSYLVGSQVSADTLERFVWYNTGNFMGGPQRLLKGYGFAPSVLYGDSIWSFYSDNTAWRNYFAGNTVIGPNQTATAYKLAVYGASYYSDSVTLATATAVTDTSGYDVMMRDRTTGALTRIRADQLGVGGGGAPTYQAVITSTSYSVASGVTHVQLTAGSSGVTITLPAASSWPGRMITIGGGLNNNATISPAFLSNNGGTLATLYAGASIDLISDGTDWVQVIRGTQMLPQSWGAATGEDIFDGFLNANTNGQLHSPVFRKIKAGSGITVTNTGNAELEIAATGGGGGGANTALSNLASVAINTSLISDADNTDDLGSTGNAWKDVYAKRFLSDGSTSGGIIVQSDALGNTINGTTLTGQGVIWTQSGGYVDSDQTLSDVNTAQNVFPSGFDVWTLQAATTYRFKGKYFISTGGGNVSVSMSFALGGGASVTSIRYGMISGIFADGSTSGTQLMGRQNTVSSWVVTSSSATSGRYIDFEGTIRMNAGGTITPQITFSAAPGGTNLFNADSFIEFTPIGTNTITSIGPVN